MLEAEGEEGAFWLETVAAGPPSARTEAAAHILRHFGRAEPEIAWRCWMQGNRRDLETGAICLQRLAQPHWRAWPMIGELKAIAKVARETLDRTARAEEIATAVNRVLYHAKGFRAVAPVPSRPGPLLLGEVLASRRADPLAMGLVYILVAGRAGLSLDPIYLRGRLRLVSLRGTRPFLVDPANQGALTEWEGLQRSCSIDAFQVLQRHDWCPGETILRAISMRLVRRYLGRGDGEKAARFQTVASEFERALAFQRTE